MLPLESVVGEETAANGATADPKIALRRGSELAGVGRFLPNAVQYDGSKLSAGGLVAVHDPKATFHPMRNRRRSDVVLLLESGEIIASNRSMTLTEFYQQPDPDQDNCINNGVA
jgi:hypothetical protein